MSSLATNAITDASGGNTATINGQTPTESNMAGRNLIINGAMQVAQRGTSFSSITSSTYTLDRFAVRDATAVSQSTDVPSGEGFKNSLFYDNNGTRSSINIRQPMEDVTRLLNDTAVTLSFWIKSSAATTISVDLCDANATNVSVTTSWARYTVTFPATSNLNSGDTYEAGAGWVDFNFGTDYPDIYITGVQLEVGSVATPFEHRFYGQELALCQRYFIRLYDPPLRGVTTGGLSGGASRMGITFPTIMRAIPTVTISGTFSFWSGNGVTTGSTSGGAWASTVGAEVDITIVTTLGSAGRAMLAYTTNSTTKWLDAFSEL